MGVHSRIGGAADAIRGIAHVGNLYVNRSMIGAVVGVQPFGGEGLSGNRPKGRRPALPAEVHGRTHLDRRHNLRRRQHQPAGAGGVRFSQLERPPKRGLPARTSFLTLHDKMRAGSPRSE